MERCDSYHSISTSCDNGDKDTCRICHSKDKPDSPLISPCDCSGSVRYVHHTCLQQWIRSSNSRSCELCKFHFITCTKIKPFREWKKLDMSLEELFEVFFYTILFFFNIVPLMSFLHKMIAHLCQFPVEELRIFWLAWPYWAIFVAFYFLFEVGITYLVCKMYLQLFRRWKAFNILTYVLNAPNLQLQPLSTASVLTSKDIEQLSSDEDDFHSCQSCNSSASISHSCSRSSVNTDVPKNINGKIPTAETCCIKITLTSVTDSKLVPLGDHSHLLSEVVDASTDPVFASDEQNLNRDSP